MYNAYMDIFYADLLNNSFFSTHSKIADSLGILSSHKAYAYRFLLEKEELLWIY